MVALRRPAPLWLRLALLLLALCLLLQHVDRRVLTHLCAPPARASHPAITPRTLDPICHASQPSLQPARQLAPLLRRHRTALSSYLRTRRVHFATYGDADYARTRARLGREAMNSTFFDDVRVYAPDDLSPTFRARFSTVLGLPRGAGYWIWKYDIVARTLHRMRHGDFLVYMDADTRVNPLGRDRFDMFLRLVNVSRAGSLSFSWGDPESWWTSDRLFASMGLAAKPRFWQSDHLVATVMIFQKTDVVMNMMRLWRDVLWSDPFLITDVYSYNTTRDDFRDHRHDQSILSLVRKCMGTVVMHKYDIHKTDALAPLQIASIKK